MKQIVAGWGVQFIAYWVYTQSLKLKIWHFIKGLGLCLFRGGGPVKNTLYQDSPDSQTGARLQMRRLCGRLPI